MAQWRLWTDSDRDHVAPSSATGGAGLLDHLAQLELTPYDRVTGGKLPRNHHARSYRLTAGSAILAATTVCFRRMRNCLEVSTGLVANSDIPASRSVMRELLQFLLTDAYRCSGLCALTFARFSQRHEQAFLGRVEAFIRECGVELSAWPHKMITAEEGRQLYLRIVGLSPAAQASVSRLHDLGRVRTETVCYLLSSGIWSVSQTEGLLLACSMPDAVLAGGASPNDRHLHRYAMDCARVAVLAGRLEDYLENQWEEQDGTVRYLPQDRRRVAVEVFAGTGLRRCVSLPSVPIGEWSRSAKKDVDAQGLMVAIVAASRDELQQSWTTLLRSARSQCDRIENSDPLALAVPADFDQLSTAVRQRCLEAASDLAIEVLAAPDTFAQLTAEARRKLSFARIIRK